MSHIFFIHSSVDGHLSCFRVLATVRSAAVREKTNVMNTNGGKGQAVMDRDVLGLTYVHC